MEIANLTHMLLLGLMVFGARVVDVSLGTLRTINLIYGRANMAFFLGFLETLIWIYVISTLFVYIKEMPVLGVFYALGFATGNVVGLKIEKKLAIGAMVLRVIKADNALELAKILREQGYRITTFNGEGRDGPVTMLYIVCKRKDLGLLIKKVNKISPKAFYMTEQAGSVSHIIRPSAQNATGWRAIFKKK